MRNRIVLLPVFMLTIAVARAQSDEWHESNNWRLYHVAVGSFQGVAPGALHRFSSRPLAEDSMRAFMAHPTRIAAGRQPRWRGAYVATCVLDEVTRKIDLSVDGTFFLDESTKTYYQVAPEIQKAWAAYLAACFRSLQLQK